MIPYAGMRIYPEPRMFHGAGIGPHQRLTVATHLTIDRLIRLRTLIGRLDSRTTRVSAAVFIPHHLKTVFLSSHRKARAEIYEEIGCGRMQAVSAAGSDGQGVPLCAFVDVHIIYADTVDQSNSWCEDMYMGKDLEPDSCLYYPIQHLRQYCHCIRTNRVLISIDVNLIPSTRGLFSRALQEMDEYALEHKPDPKRVWVINIKGSICDASGTFDGCTPGRTLARNMPPSGTHAPLHDSKEPHPIEYQFAYEPYFIGRAEDLPLYDERFWYGNDRVQQCYDTAAAGFKFIILTPSVGSLIHWEYKASSATTLPLAMTRAPMGLLASVIRRAECVWPGTRDRLVCDPAYVRKNHLWYKLTTPAFYQTAGCMNTEQRLPRSWHALPFEDALDGKRPKGWPR